MKKKVTIKVNWYDERATPQDKFVFKLAYLDYIRESQIDLDNPPPMLERLRATLEICAEYDPKWKDVQGIDVKCTKYRAVRTCYDLITLQNENI